MTSPKCEVHTEKLGELSTRVAILEAKMPDIEQAQSELKIDLKAVSTELREIRSILNRAQFAFYGALSMLVLQQFGILAVIKKAIL